LLLATLLGGIIAAAGARALCASERKIDD